MEIALDTLLKRGDYFATDRTGRYVRCPLPPVGSAAPRGRTHQHAQPTDHPAPRNRSRIWAPASGWQATQDNPPSLPDADGSPCSCAICRHGCWTITEGAGRSSACPAREVGRRDTRHQTPRNDGTESPYGDDRIVEGDIVRLEKGVLPQTIVHTRNTIGSPLQAGVPVKLYLKAFKDGHAHYIINAAPEWWGGQP